MAQFIIVEEESDNLSQGESFLARSESDDLFSWHLSPMQNSPGMDSDLSCSENDQSDSDSEYLPARKVSLTMPDVLQKN
jgi:hypothetical protein